ncbi:hypothetical protein Tco_0829407 [Tanacetum coccineum]
MCDKSWGRISFARARIKVNSSSDLKNEMVMAIPNEEGNGHTYDTCPKRVRETEPKSASMDERDDVFVEVTNRKQKGKKAAQQPKLRHISGVRLTKPKLYFFGPKMSSGYAIGKPDSSKANGKGESTLNAKPFDMLNTLDEEVDSGVLTL